MASSDHINLRFWGIRGSISTSGVETAKYGGNTSCVEVRCGEKIIVFDAGTGLRELGLFLEKERPLDVDHFFSHTHWDHVSGLPFFSAAYCPDSTIRVHAGHLTGHGGIEAALRQAMAVPLFPVPLDIFQAGLEFRDFEPGAVLDVPGGVSVRTAPLNHPNGATGYRVDYGGKSVCYITDTEHTPGAPDENILALIDGADLVIYDSTYTDEEFPRYAGWGHSTWQEGVRLCQAASVSRLAIFHHDPSRTDAALDEIGRLAQAELDGTFVARDGLSLTI